MPAAAAAQGRAAEGKEGRKRRLRGRKSRHQGHDWGDSGFTPFTSLSQIPLSFGPGAMGHPDPFVTPSAAHTPGQWVWTPQFGPPVWQPAAWSAFSATPWGFPEGEMGGKPGRDRGRTSRMQSVSRTPSRIPLAGRERDRDREARANSQSPVRQVPVDREGERERRRRERERHHRERIRGERSLASSGMRMPPPHAQAYPQPMHPMPFPPYYYGHPAQMPHGMGWMPGAEEMMSGVPSGSAEMLHTNLSPQSSPDLPPSASGLVRISAAPEGTGVPQAPPAQASEDVGESKGGGNMPVNEEEENVKRTGVGGAGNGSSQGGADNREEVRKRAVAGAVAGGSPGLFVRPTS